MIRNLRRRLAVFLVALTALAGVSVVAAAPAHASYSSCPSTKICAYTDSNGNGSQWIIGWPGLQICDAVPGGWNDVISSAINLSSNYRVVFYSEAGCWGGAITVWPNSIQNGFWPMNDATSSYRLYQA